MEQVKLSKQEKETAIIFNEQEDYATIETYNRRLIKRLEVLCKNHKDFFTVENDNEMGIYKIPKKFLHIKKPYILSKEKKKERSKRWKKTLNERWVARK